MAIAVRRHWREFVAVIAPFILVLPLLVLTSQWMSLSIGWFTAGVMKWLAQFFGQGFIHLFFLVPNFAVSIIAGLALGFGKVQGALRLAWLFGSGMFVAHTVAWLLTNPFAWHVVLVNLVLVALPVTAVAVLRKLRPVKPPGSCQECAYNLTGNESGVCPECGSPIAHDELGTCPR